VPDDRVHDHRNESDDNDGLMFPTRLTRLLTAIVVVLAVGFVAGAGASTTARPRRGAVDDLNDGLLLDGWGGLHAAGPSGAMPTVIGAPYWPGWDIARGITRRVDRTAGFVVDAWGGLHWFSVGTPQAAPAVFGAAYWPGREVAEGVALMPDGTGGFVVDDSGALHWFALGRPSAAPKVFAASPAPGSNLARGVALLPDGSGGYVVDATGALHWFSVRHARPTQPADTGLSAPGQDRVQGIAITASGQGFSFTRDAVVATFTSTAGDGTSISSAIQAPYRGPAPIRDGTM
jgi:hypothetical protein